MVVSTGVAYTLAQVLRDKALAEQVEANQILHEQLKRAQLNERLQLSWGQARESVIRGTDIHMILSIGTIVSCVLCLYEEFTGYLVIGITKEPLTKMKASMFNSCPRIGEACRGNKYKQPVTI
mmetsp:Transcript_25203/g.54295  ORF Transcript_25203/g.54295 Transcript_25203/m.54295 type:complete len:123 (-) Transcript_25203:34-402(-)